MTALSVMLRGSGSLDALLEIVDFRRFASCGKRPPPNEARLLTFDMVNGPSVTRLLLMIDASQSANGWNTGRPDLMIDAMAFKTPTVTSVRTVKTVRTFYGEKKEKRKKKKAALSCASLL
jgi:hypothetical protein